MKRKIQTATGHGLGTAYVSMQMTTFSLSGMHQTIRLYTQLSVPNLLPSITANVQFMFVSQFAGLCHSANCTSCCDIRILPFDTTAYLLHGCHWALFKGHETRDNFQVSHHHEYR